MFDNNLNNINQQLLRSQQLSERSRKNNPSRWGELFPNGRVVKVVVKETKNVVLCIQQHQQHNSTTIARKTNNRSNECEIRTHCALQGYI